jgi:sugar (pentulose or hexulose) kinase
VGTLTRRTPVVCGIDIGSTNTKVVALDETGRVAARNPSDLSIDTHVLFDAIEEMIVQACATEYSVSAVSAAGVGEDGVLVDETITALGRVLAWFDPRRVGLFQQLLPQLPEADQLCVATDPARTLVGWYWARQQPGVEQATQWVTLTDFAAARWTGTAFISDTLAARTAAWQSHTRQWLPDRVQVTLGDPALLPPVVRTGDVVGPLVSARLTQAGVLAPGAVAVAGGHDHPIGGWGVNQFHPGAILDSMGTAEVVVAQSPIPNVPRSNHVDVAPGIRAAGTTLLRVEELARNIEWASQSPAVGEVLRRIIDGSVPPNSFLTSSTFIPGTPGGGRPRYTTDAPADPVSRASAVAGALAQCGADAVAAVAAHMPEGAPVFAAGGWSRSPGWVQVKEMISGSEVTVIPEPEVTAVGAALLAARAIDWKASPQIALSLREAAL